VGGENHISHGKKMNTGGKQKHAHTKPIDYGGGNTPNNLTDADIKTKASKVKRDNQEYREKKGGRRGIKNTGGVGNWNKTTNSEAGKE